MATARFHIKVLWTPLVPVDTMVAAMRQTFDQVGIGTWAHTVATLETPSDSALLDLDVGDCEVSAELRTLFGSGLATWSGWVYLGAPGNAAITGAPATVSRNPAVCNIYARGSDNALWQQAFAEGKWHGWGRHDDGGLIASEPAVDSMGPDHEQVFARGMDNQVWHKFWTRTGGWKGWFALGAPPGGFIGAPATVSRNGNVANVYVRGADNALWQLAWFDNAWHGWQRHGDGAQIASEPAVASMGPDHEHVFARGFDGQVWHKYWTAAGGWVGWFALGAPGAGFSGRPSTVSRRGDVCNIYVRGNDGALWQRPYFNRQWHGWSRHADGGLLSDSPAPGSMNNTHEHMFVRGTDGHVWHKFWFGENRSREVVIFLVRSTNGASGALNGCAAFPPGQPGAIVTAIASRWTLAHELGHLYGLPHISGESCDTPGYQPTRLMTGCGTSLLVAPPPDLTTSEASTMTSSPFMS